MSQFKLIAIRPLHGCDTLFRKNLKEGVIYKFYKNYCFFDRNGIEIKLSNNNLTYEINNIKIDESSSNLYTSDNDVSINISAVVGENGSGKSSLIELFLYTIYWMSVVPDNDLLTHPNNQLLNEYYLLENAISEFNDIVNDPSDKFIKSKGYIDLTNYIFTLSKEYKIYPKSDAIVNNKLSIEFIAFVNQLLKKKKTFVQSQINEVIELEDKLRLSFNSELIYEIDGEIHLFRSEGIDFKHFTGEIKNSIVVSLAYESEFPDLQKFFYTNLLNYSHHALNSKILGSWINSLFHKNDAYKCPVVINPMRDEGNFKINLEETFAKERLLINLIHTDNQKKEFLFLGEAKNKISNIILKIKEDSILNPINQDNRGWDEYFDGSMTSEKWIYECFIRPIVDQTSEEKFRNIPYSYSIIGYIIRKFYRLIQTYPDYNDITPAIRAIENPDYAEALKTHFDKDQSHTSFKIRRALNYLEQNIQSENQDAWKFIVGKTELLFELKDLKKVCGISDEDNFLEICKKIPPSLFEIEIEFVQNELSKEELLDAKIDALISDRKLATPSNTYRFGKLSSGEKQFVFTWQSILYHLNNLESVHSLKENSKRQAYQSVNLILDEVELYMHPEYQRNFIKNLLEEIKSIKLNGIKNINILFATHSPFILSDIPVNNILHLQNGQIVENSSLNETFAANIHQILANDFFLKRGFIGEFAKSKIQNVLDLIHNDSSDITSEQIEQGFQTIRLIGEPVIKNKLRIALTEKFPFYNSNYSSIQEQIRLQEQNLEYLKTLIRKRPNPEQ